jgi:hypothetical protein
VHTTGLQFGGGGAQSWGGWQERSVTWSVWLPSLQ